ncbi:MAG: type IV secretion system protein [Muribaculaceae bacterium]|nr:type IV secretion system protein [Muribaculaceae bacterium]
MADRIEPPILMSRLMTFVFAASLVVLAVLFITLYRMFPLNRPQVFFLLTQQRNEREIELVDLKPNASNKNIEYFVRGFIREYVKARNEIVPNIGEMRNKWNNNSDSLVHAWSSPAVYDQFKSTQMWNAIMNDIPDFVLSCPVEFTSPIKAFNVPQNDFYGVSDTYDVTFSYYCTYNDGQVGKKNYTIRIKVAKTEPNTMKWQDRLTNPLGIYVSEYSVQSDNGDPLDTGYLDQ